MVISDKVTNGNARNSFKTLPARLAEVHGDRYLYSRLVFVNATEKVIITCREHGDFEQTLKAHLAGGNCPKCNGKLRKGNYKITSEEWVIKAVATHGDKYDYSRVDYKGVGVKVDIVCPVHGVFSQVAYSHIKGHGCMKCANKFSTPEFIAKASIAHKGLYSYPNSIYTNWYDCVRIECPIHGEFLQEAHTHLRGSGCQQCATRGFKKTLPGLLYYIRFKDVYKIGITNNSISTRYTAEELQDAEILLEQWYDSGEECYNTEQDILNKHSDLKYMGAPVLKNGNTELFYTDINIKEYFESYKTHTSN